MNSQRAMTVVEILIALAIFAVLLSIAIPNFAALVQDRKAEVALEKIARAINFARTRAITSGELVTLCPSDDGLQCQSSWLAGGMVFSDRNADRSVNDEDEVLLVLNQDIKGGTIRWRSFQNKQYLQINAQGFTRNQNGSFTYCPDDKIAEKARQLVINRTGRTRFAVDRDGDGVKESTDGKALSC